LLINLGNLSDCYKLRAGTNHHIWLVVVKLIFNALK